jgi:TolB protein
VAPGAVEGQAHSPTWSPDGGRLAFSLRSTDHSTDKDIWVVNADGSEVRRLSRVPSLSAGHGGSVDVVGSLDWSPDGGRIALTAAYGWDASIYVVNTNGTNLRRLAEAADPHWSPDGRRIAFEQWPPDPTKHSLGDADSEIYVMAVDSGAMVRLTRNVVSDTGPVWSPDGRRIAFVHGNLGESQEIYVMNADGTGVTRLTHNQLADATPAWQPVVVP